MATMRGGALDTVSGARGAARSALRLTTGAPQNARCVLALFVPCGPPGDYEADDYADAPDGLYATGIPASYRSASTTGGRSGSAAADARQSIGAGGLPGIGLGGGGGGVGGGDGGPAGGRNLSVGEVAPFCQPPLLLCADRDLINFLATGARAPSSSRARSARCDAGRPLRPPCASRVVSWPPGAARAEIDQVRFPDNTLEFNSLRLRVERVADSLNDLNFSPWGAPRVDAAVCDWRAARSSRQHRGWACGCVACAGGPTFNFNQVLSLNFRCALSALAGAA